MYKIFQYDNLLIVKTVRIIKEKYVKQFQCQYSYKIKNNVDSKGTNINEHRWTMASTTE